MHPGDLQLVRRRLLNAGKDAKGRRELARHAIIQDAKFAVRRNKGKRSRRLPFRHVDAIVKVHVVDRDRSVATRVSAHDQVFVECEAQLRVSGEVGFHLDASVDRTVEHVSVVGEQDVEALENVDKDFVFLVVVESRLSSVCVYRTNDWFVNGIGGRCFRIDHGSRIGDWIDDNGFIVDERFQVFRARDLRVAIINHLV